MSAVLVEHPHPGVTVIRLSRPDVFNALSNAVVESIARALEAAEADDTRAVVIAGDHRAFAAGADITELLDPGPDLERWDAIWSCPIPLIAAVRGLALGGGLELAMSCDILVVAEDARLAQPEIRLGLMPGAGGTQRLIRTVGKSLAMEMVLLAREIGGAEAYARGLASHCLPSAEVEARALEVAQALAAGPPLAIRAAKRALLGAYDASLRDGIEAERAGFRHLLTTQDGRAGIEAFTKKQRTTWSGQ